jgi:hypothetical protein
MQNALAIMTAEEVYESVTNGGASDFSGSMSAPGRGDAGKNR